MVRKSGRYAARGPEAEFEPGSRGRVLRNLLGIRSVREMARAESRLLLEAQERLVKMISPDHRFTADDIREMHRVWLESIYPWAGEYRGVNLAKGDFHFAAAREVPRLMGEFERRYLAQYTPCSYSTEPEIAEALAVVHAELILIHPFREGNGRCARLLALLMALQAGLPPLDYGGLTAAGGKRYIGAIHAAMVGDYGPMRALFSAVIRRSSDRVARRGP
ncbi:MAG: Fic family protein [Betaproteobacteria bacterium]|nr:Fic family protein [Betaproteobacteria bacterium]